MSRLALRNKRFNNFKKKGKKEPFTHGYKI